MMHSVILTPEGLRFLYMWPFTCEAEVAVLAKGTDTILAKAKFAPVAYAGSLQEAFVPFTAFRDSALPKKLTRKNIGSYLEYVYLAGDIVMVDPHARLVAGRQPFGERQPGRPLQIRAGFASEDYDWGDDRELKIPFENVVSYYLHVRGFTQDPSSKVRHRGTFRGLQEKIPYLQQLGINQVILMPAYEFEEIMTREQLRGAALEAGVVYYPAATAKPGAPAAPAMPDAAAMSAETAVPDGVAMPAETAAADETGKPAASAVTDAAEEKKSAGSVPDRKLNYWGYTRSWYFAPKAGYSASDRPDTEFRDMVRAMHRAGIEVVMEFSFPDEVPADLAVNALTMWVRSYHVDGFRLLARDGLCQMAASSSLLAGTKLLCPYFPDSAGENAPVMNGSLQRVPYRHLADCNIGFRTDCRRLLKGDDGILGAFISRVRQDRDQVACVNYLTDHDGFTLWDLVSYDRKHNEENGEQGMDGAASEYSWNCGAEGETKKQGILALRLRQAKNALAMLLLSKGTPMLLAGDEFGNSQGGNNNPYCIDSKVTWLNWSTRKKDRELFAFAQTLIAFRKAHPAIFAPGQNENAYRNEQGYPAVSCHTGRAWYATCDYQDKHIGMMYCYPGAEGDTYLYVAYNFHWEAQEFALPYLPDRMNWKPVLSTDPQTVKAAAVDSSDEKTTERLALFPGRSVTILEGTRI